MAAVSLPSPEAVSAQALDAAHAIEDPALREEQAERVAVAAAACGSVAVAEEALADLTERSARARVHLTLVRRLGPTAPEAARLHLSRAAALLRAVGRWRPRPTDGLLVPDAARVAVIRHAITLGDMALARATAGQIERAGRWRVEGALELADETGVTELITMVAEIPEADERLRLAERLGSRIPSPDSVALVVGAALNGQLRLEAPAVAQLCAHAGAVLAEAGATEPAARLWSEAVSIVEEQDEVGWWDSALLCRIAADQLRYLGPGLAELTVQRGVDRAGTQPLAAEPHQPFAWRPLLRLALSEPALAVPLRDRLRKCKVVPPGWCFGMGLLEAATGRPERGARLAKVLVDSYGVAPTEPDALWLAALLWARLGDIPACLAAADQLLGQAEGPFVAQIPGDARGPRRVEAHLVDALIDLSAIDEAADIARVVEMALLRAELLTELAAKGGGAGLALEAAAALDEAAARGEPGISLVGRVPARLLRVLWRHGEAPAALELLRRSLDRARPLPDPLWVEQLLALGGVVLDLDVDVFTQAIRGAWEERLRGAASPEARCALLIAWLEDAARTEALR